jgi:Chaperone of endosialidase
MGANFNSTNLGNLASSVRNLTGGNLPNVVGQAGQVFSEKLGQYVPRSNIGQMPTMDDSLLQPAPPMNVSNSQVGYGNFPLSPNTLGSRSFSNVFDVQSGDSDYAKAAKLTAQGNLAAAQAQATANRVNQINPYGSIQYYQTGVDAQGNPTYSAAAALSPEQQALLDAQNYQSLGLAQTANRALGNVYNTYGRAFDVAPFMQQEVGQGPQFTQLGQADQMMRGGQTEQLQRSLDQNAGMSGWDRASNLIMQRLEPQMQRQEQQLEQRLASQGIPVGSEAYTRAKQDLAMQQNDLRTQAQLQAQGIQQNLFGQELAAGQFGNLATTQQQQNLLQNLGFTNEAMQQDFANRQAQLAFNNQLGQQGYQNQLAQQQANNLARQNNFALASYLRGLPMQELNALRAGSQVTNPSFIGVPQTGQVGGPDLLSAYQAQQNANIAAQNRQAAQQSNLQSGLFSLGGSLLGNLGGVGNAIGGVVNTVGNIGGGLVRGATNVVSSIGNAVGKLFSDSRLKENIKPVGVLDNGLTLYSFEYKDEVKNHPMGGEGVHVGVMADEVEKVFPYAVSTLDDGYKVVDYRLLP